MTLGGKDLIRSHITLKDQGGGGAACCYAMCKLWSEVMLTLNICIVYTCLLGAYTSNLYTH